MHEILHATKQDKEDVIDFANYVFSQSRVPHDFKTLIPVAYADEVEGLGAEHYLIKKDGKIRALVADRRSVHYYGSEALRTGFIGTVSVHPYARGEGYMKALMPYAVERARADGVDLLILGGQRQRYNYFGFESAGCKLTFHVTATNLRHTLSDVSADGITFAPLTREDVAFCLALYQTLPIHADRTEEDFQRCAAMWNMPCRTVRRNGELIGYAVGSFAECVLRDEEDFPAVLKALFLAEGWKSADIAVPPYARDRIAFLSRIAEGYSIGHVDMVRILNWKRVLEVMLRFRASYAALCDGEASFAVEGARYTVKVEQGVPTVTQAPAPEEECLSPVEAERLLFQNLGLLEDRGFYNWLPLPLFVLPGDAF
jgi:GNAT superfamily N-acetyltransferase